MGAKKQNFRKTNFFVYEHFCNQKTVLDVTLNAEQLFQVTFFEKMTSSPSKTQKTLKSVFFLIFLLSLSVNSILLEELKKELTEIYVLVKRKLKSVQWFWRYSFPKVKFDASTLNLWGFLLTRFMNRKTFFLVDGPHFDLLYRFWGSKSKFFFFRFFQNFWFFFSKFLKKKVTLRFVP